MLILSIEIGFWYPVVTTRIRSICTFIVPGSTGSNDVCAASDVWYWFVSSVFGVVMFSRKFGRRVIV